MNERGFFTLIGLCFLIVAAVIVQGVQASEGNYYSVADDFVEAAELQNIADSALIEAVDIIKSPEFELKESKKIFYNRNENQHEINLNNSYDADVKVFYEYGKYTDDKGNIQLMEREYKSGNVINDKLISDTNKKGVIIISVASRKSEKIDRKIYRRAIAYFFTDEDKETPTTIYFMNSLKDD